MKLCSFALQGGPEHWLVTEHALHTRARVAEEDDSPEPKKTPWTSPPTSSPIQSSSTQLSPEQLARMEKKKSEAEAQLLTKRLGTSNIGPSWVQALQAEFKKTYMEKVGLV